MRWEKSLAFSVVRDARDTPSEGAERICPETCA